MASKKKKFEGPEAVVTAPRMGKLEKGMYDYSQMTPEEKRKKLRDMAVGPGISNALKATGYAKGGKVDGIAKRGLTKGRMR